MLQLDCRVAFAPRNDGELIQLCFNNDLNITQSALLFYASMDRTLV